MALRVFSMLSAKYCVFVCAQQLLQLLFFITGRRKIGFCHSSSSIIGAIILPS